MLFSNTIVALLAGLVAAQNGMPPHQGHAAATLETDLPLVGRRGGDGHALALPPEDFAHAAMDVEGAGAKAGLRGAESGTDEPDDENSCVVDGDCATGVCAWDFHCKEEAPNGDACAEDDDCESGVCGWNFFCKEKLPNGHACGENDDCESGVCSLLQCKEELPNGSVCADGDDCESGVCAFFQCKELSENGSVCTDDDDCKSGRCSWFKCKDKK